MEIAVWKCRIGKLDGIIPENTCESAKFQIDSSLYFFFFFIVKAHYLPGNEIKSLDPAQ